MKKAMVTLAAFMIVIALLGFDYKLKNRHVKEERYRLEQTEKEQLYVRQEIVKAIRDHAAVLQEVEEHVWTEKVRRSREEDSTVYQEVVAL